MKKKIVLYIILVILVVGIIVTVAFLNYKKENKEDNNTNEETQSTEATTKPSPTPITNVSEMTEQDKSIFNSNFDFCIGKNVKGARVKSLIQAVQYSNEHSSIRKVDLVINGDATANSSNIKATGTYSVSFDYDNNGLICKAIIEEN